MPRRDTIRECFGITVAQVIAVLVITVAFIAPDAIVGAVTPRATTTHAGTGPRRSQSWRTRSKRQRIRRWQCLARTPDSVHGVSRTPGGV